MAIRDLITPETEKVFDLRPGDDDDTSPIPPPIQPVRSDPPSAEPMLTPGSAFRLFATTLCEQIRGGLPSLDRASALRFVGQGVSIVGSLLVCLALFEGFAGRITEQRDQRKLRGAFEQILEGRGAFAAVAGDGIIPPGTPVASLEIPKIGVRKIVVEGTASPHLRQGPGHLRSTPLPGQHGNAVIAGRRTTYGSPFRNIDRLMEGDEIVTVTPFGRFTYLVRDVETLEAGDPDRLGATMTDNLTLTTSDPVYRASRRLVVVARLEGGRSAYPDPLRQAQVSIDEGAFFGAASQAIPTFGWTLAVLISIALARALYTRWKRWPAYLLTTPVALAALFGWLESMVALLPSTL